MKNKDLSNILYGLAVIDFISATFFGVDFTGVWWSPLVLIVMGGLLGKQDSDDSKHEINSSEAQIDDNETLSRVVKIVVDKLGVEKSKVTEDAKFIDDFGADSLDTVELIMEFEDEFDIEIPDEDAETILSVRQAVEYIDNH